MKEKINIKQIASLLRDELPRLLPTLFPDKVSVNRGDSYRLGSNGGLYVEKKSDNIFFHCFESQISGDAFGLIQYATSCNFVSSLIWAKSFLGLVEGEPLPQPKPRQKEKPKPDNKQRTHSALKIYNYSSSLSGTYAEQYFQWRGIDIDYLPDNFRFNKSVYNVTTEQNHPSAVMPVKDVNGNIAAIHFISLDPFTSRKIKEGEGVKAKLSKGPIKGCAVRLSPDDCEVVICEGVEDGLSLLQMHPNLCVWSGLGGNIRNIQLPPEVTKVVIATDNDEAGDANVAELYKRLSAEGKQVSVLYPPQGFKDFNEYLMRGK